MLLTKTLKPQSLYNQPKLLCVFCVLNGKKLERIFTEMAVKWAKLNFVVLKTVDNFTSHNKKS